MNTAPVEPDQTATLRAVQLGNLDGSCDEGHVAGDSPHRPGRG